MNLDSLLLKNNISDIRFVNNSWYINDIEVSKTMVYKLFNYEYTLSDIKEALRNYQSTLDNFKIKEPTLSKNIVLTTKDKEILEKYMTGDITTKEASRSLNLKSDTFYKVVKRHYGKDFEEQRNKFL